MEKTKTNYGYLNLPSDLNVFKAEGGTEVVLDIIPYIVTDPNHLDHKKHPDDAIVGNLWWKRPLKVHKKVGPDEITVICPLTYGKRCPICDYGSKRRKEGAEWEELKEIFPKDRSVFIVSPVDTAECDVDYEEGIPHVFDMSDHLFLKYLDEEVATDIDFEDFPNPYFGSHLEIRFRSKKFGKSSYAEVSKIDIVPRKKSDQYDDEYLETVPELDELMKHYTYAELEALYFDMADVDEADAVEVIEDEPEVPRKRKPRAKLAPEPEEEPEEEAPRKKRRPREEPAEDLGEQEEAPRKKRTPRANPVPEPEEEPVEEPEEEAPRKKRKPRESAGAKKDKCPHGHRFGVDTEKFNECDDCVLWDACADKLEEEEG